MLSKRWDTAGRWCIHALLLIVFVGPFWGIVATAFSGAPVKPGELLARLNQFSFENFIFAWMDIGVWQYLLNSILVVFFGTVLQVSVSALAAYALARKKFRGVALVSPVILSTMMLPEEVIAIPLYMIINWRSPVYRCLALQQLPRDDFAGRRLGIFHLCPDRIYVGDS